MDGIASIHFPSRFKAAFPVGQREECSVLTPNGISFEMTNAAAAIGGTGTQVDRSHILRPADLLAAFRAIPASSLTSPGQHILQLGAGTPYPGIDGLMGDGFVVGDHFRRDERVE